MEATAKIELPRYWANLIRLVPRNPQINVINLHQSNFMHFQKSLKDNYIHIKIKFSGQVEWNKIKCVQNNANSLGNYFTNILTKISKF